MGRRKEPDAIKRLTGAAYNDPGRLNPEQPPTKGYPIRPLWLTNPVAIAEYDRVAGLLHPLGLVGELDSMVLAAYAAEFATFVACAEGVEEKGVLVRGKLGNPITNPYLFNRRQATNMMLALCKELGLSPSSRQNLRMAEASPNNPNANSNDPWDRFTVVEGGKA